MSTASDKREAKRAASRLAVAARIAEATKSPILAPSAAMIKSASFGLSVDSPQTVHGPVSKAVPAQCVKHAESVIKVPIELLVIVRNEPDKGGIGYAFFSPGLTGGNGLSVVLNRDRLLVSRTLTKSDTLLTTFLYGCLVAETLALRRAESALVAALQQHLVRQLYVTGGFGRNHVFADFAVRLSLSPVLEPLKSLSIYGPAPREEAQLVSSIVLEVAPSVADAPWKRLSRRRLSVV
jgi:hypothetical protein